MKRILTLTLFAASIGLAYAQTPVVVQDAKTTAAELKIKCQVLKVAKNDCVIAHFSNTDDDWSLSKKPSDVYRVLNGKTADNLFVATDFYRNGQKQADTFASPHAAAVLKSWVNSELQLTATNFNQYRPDGSKEYTYDLVEGLEDGSMTAYYPSGSIESTGANQNDEHVGIWTYWHDNGQKQSTGERKGDLKIGRWMYWYENGNNEETEFFDDQGQLTSTSIGWYENGKKKHEVPYTAGKRVGAATYWYDNGQKETQGKFVNDEYNGEWTYWDEAGHKTETILYKNGEVISNNSEWPEHSSPYDATKEAGVATVEAAKAELSPATYDAQSSAYLLNTNCTKFIRADQCVIAYFDKNDNVQSSSKGAKYYRVLHGKVNDLYIIQDFYRAGQKQSDVVFARSEDGILNSFDTADLNTEGSITGYKPNGKIEFSDRPGSAVDVAKEAAAAVVDAAK